LGPLIDRDEEHLRLLKIAYYITAGVTAFFSVFALFYVALGGVMMSSGGLPQAPGQDPRLMGSIFLIMGLAFLIFGGAGTFLMWYAARCLGNHRRRVYCLIVAALCCLQIPYGTAIGVCTFIVLGRDSVKELFEGPAAPTNGAA